ncbi:putative ras GTPase-activating-like protein IQGAP3 [Apostichopus japonicus]|uniref:Putative ras GTPase-activating-like protein IQGAP3 n=1 Tax=Stichopus japonicus TaxID=307972 RepID=A0A2G8LG63_STIJA|nr:putative ras GTPase-activating-like protein IQGAP3 [Apostichopus japonicus]
MGLGRDGVGRGLGLEGWGWEGMGLGDEVGRGMGLGEGPGWGRIVILCAQFELKAHITKTCPFPKLSPLVNEDNWVRKQCVNLRHSENTVIRGKREKERGKRQKCDRLKWSVREGEEQDVYDTLLTHAEIQGNVTKVNLDVQLNEVNTLLDTQDATKLLAALQSPAIGLKDVQSENAEYYLTTLIQAREVKKENTESPNLEKEDLQAAVNAANILAKEDRDRTKAVGDINTAISEGSPEDLVNLLMRSEATLPEVFPYVADLYQSNYED